MSVHQELSLKDVQVMVKSYWRYLRSKMLWILLIGFLFACLGAFYAYMQKPKYTAEITFSPENEKGGGMGIYAGIAAQFGVDLGGGGGGVFEGENLIVFLRSKMLVEKALLSTMTVNNQSMLLVDYYLSLGAADDDKKDVKPISFKNYKPGNRQVDSVFNKIIKDVSNSLVVEKLDKKVNILVARMTSTDEVFAKAFVEEIVANGIDYYVDYRSGRSKENVEILKRQTDSVHRSLTGGIVAVAATNDLNVNPMRQIMRTGVQKKQVDIQANGALYAELLKQLELSKIALRKETPLIQIIDTPRFPLEKKKMGRLKGALIFAIIGSVLAVIFFAIRKASKPTIETTTTVVAV